MVTFYGSLNVYTSFWLTRYYKRLGGDGAIAFGQHVLSYILFYNTVWLIYTFLM